nr:hypothetical protein [Tanacetum cinerariifolium]
MLTSDSLDENKRVSIKGPSITSIPKQGPSFARQFKEPIIKELLEWYGYDTVKDYLPVAKRHIPKVIFKSPIPIKGCVLGLVNVETWDNIVKKFRMKIPKDVQTSQRGKERFDVEVMENQSDVQNHLVEIQADDHDLLVNSDNEIDDMLGYESKKYSDKEDEDGFNHAKDADRTNNLDLKLVKMGITRLYKFRREYAKPGGIKIKVTFDALNRVSGLHRALFLSFLGDLVRKHIGLKILSWKKVDKESRDKLCDEITRYFDVDMTVRKLVMHRLGKLLRNFKMKLREKYILPNLNTPSKLNELPAKYSAIVKAEEWFEFANYTTTDAYKEKPAIGKMARSKNVYHHKMVQSGYVFMKEKLIKNKEIEADEEPSHGIMWLKGRVNKDEEFTNDEIRSVGDKLKEADDKIKEGTLNLDDGTDAMTVMFGKEKEGYARGVGSGVTYKSELLNRLATQGVQLNLSSQLQVALDASKCKQWHLKKSNIVVLGTVYKSDGKQMLHNQALPNDCYKVSIVSSLVDATCIPDVGNNGLKTIKDGVGGFFAWPKNHVVLDKEVTQPTTIQKISDYNSATKLQSKHKNYVSRETMQRQARTGKSHKSLNYGS